MKEELQSKLVEILTAMQTVAGQAKDFTLAQLPDIAQSYVTYGRANATLWTVLGLALLLATLFHWGPKAIRAFGDKGASPVAFEARLIVAAAGLAIGGILFGDNVGKFLLVWFAPKVWLLKEIAGMLK